MRRAIDPQMSMVRFRTRALPTVIFHASILKELPNDERRFRGTIRTRKPFCFGWLLMLWVNAMVDYVNGCLFGKMECDCLKKLVCLHL